MSYGTGLFQGCTSLRRISLPPNTILGDSVFRDSGIEKVVIPEGYLTIGTHLCNNTQNCRLIDFPSTVTSIGDSLLWAVKNVTTIVCRAIIPPAFGGWGYNGIPVAIYVPDASVNAYKSATNWSAHTSLVKPISQYVTIN